MNRVAAWLYLKILIPLINFSLRPWAVQTRGSLTKKGEFKFFLSDIDLSVLVRSDSGKVLAKVLQKFRWWKKIFPMIGEIEIYTFQEHDTYKLLLGELGPVYSFLRNFRKIVWMERALKVAPSGYHKYKARVSLQKCVSKISKNKLARDQDNYLHLQNEIARFINRIPTLSDPINFDHWKNLSARADYLGTVVVLNPGGSKAGTLNLTPEVGLKLLALCPAFEPAPDLMEPVTLLRKDFVTRKYWLGLTRLELLIAKAVARGQPGTMPQSWIETLELQLINNNEEAALRPYFPRTQPDLQF